MSQRFAVLWVCLLTLLASTARRGVYATAISHDARRYYANATDDLVHVEDLNSPFPYYFPNQRTVDDLFPMPECHGVVLEEATIDQLQDAMSKGQLTSTKIALCYLQRVYQTNGYSK